MFTYKNWEKVCISFSNIGKCGKTAIEVLDKKNTDGFLIFKHDVETSPERALDIAKIESKYMHKGSYYVQAYLLDSDKNVRILKQIKELGHEVTYHHDVLDSCSGNFESAIQEFEKMLNKFRQNGFDVKTVCQHGNPIKNRIGYTSNRDFFRNKDIELKYKNISDVMVNYKNRLNTNYIYITDSGFKWKIVTDPENNDLNDSSKNDYEFSNIDELVNIVSRNNNCIISIHPHRWRKSLLQARIHLALFRTIRFFSKKLSKYSFLKYYFSKFYYLAKKI